MNLFEKWKNRETKKEKNSVHKMYWHTKELKKIINYIANGDSLCVELEKDSMEGTLKIGNEEIKVYLGKIELKDVLYSEFTCNMDGNITNTFPYIIRKFVLIER